MVLSSVIVCDHDRRIAEDRRSVFPYDRRRSQNFLRSAIIWKPAFNPYVITNKEAHIINGNMHMFGNVTKDKTRAISEQSQQTTKDRRHFMNYCFTHAVKFSCAVDCSLELTFAVIKVSLNCIERNEFFQT